MCNKNAAFTVLQKKIPSSRRNMESHIVLGNIKI